MEEERITKGEDEGGGLEDKQIFAQALLNKEKSKKSRTPRAHNAGRDFNECEIDQI